MAHVEARAHDAGPATADDLGGAQGDHHLERGDRRWGTDPRAHQGHLLAGVLDDVDGVIAVLERHMMHRLAPGGALAHHIAEPAHHRPLGEPEAGSVDGGVDDRLARGVELEQRVVVRCHRFVPIVDGANTSATGATNPGSSDDTSSSPSTHSSKPPSARSDMTTRSSTSTNHTSRTPAEK